PVLLVEVASASDGTDQFRMLLQATCLVRLGSTLVKSGSRYFHVKAIYIDSCYIATEYTLYLVDDAPSSDMAMAHVGYHQRIFNLTDRKDAFMFIFRIYNYLDLVKLLRETFSREYLRVTSSLVDLTSTFLVHMPKKSRRALGGTPPSTSQVVGPATGSGNFAQATIHGYDCVYIEKSIAKATGNGKEVALKALNSAEEYILEYLRIAKADDHHVIKILDILPSKIAVMPWLEPLNDFLCPGMMQSMQTQFLEGVWFLHEHNIAHLDLKPANILVGFTGSTPHLSIINFGLSIHVKDEGTLVEGYRGTPSWAAPEIGEVDGPTKTYSAILADRWSCRKVLEYI
ncbi:kinase-like domain-containing protein, partial [Lactarius hengduanensis]